MNTESMKEMDNDVHPDGTGDRTEMVDMLRNEISYVRVHAHTMKTIVEFFNKVMNDYEAFLASHASRCDVDDDLKDVINQVRDSYIMYTQRKKEDNNE